MAHLILDKTDPSCSLLVRPLLTSPLLSRCIAASVVRCERTRTETSRGKTCLLLPDSSDLPCGFRMTIGHSRPWPGYPKPHWPYIRRSRQNARLLPVRRFRDFVIGFLQIPPRGGHPCLDGWFRSLTVHRGLPPPECTSLLDTPGGFACQILLRGNNCRRAGLARDRQQHRHRASRGHSRRHRHVHLIEPHQRRR
jgi:hypothetical protein